MKETRDRWTNTKIVISLETTRADSISYNTKVKLLNALIEENFLGTVDIYLCDSSDFFFNGEPIRNFLDNDLYHLSDKGASRLAANMKYVIHTALWIENKQSNNRTRQPGMHGFHNPNALHFHFSYIPPSYFFNRRGNCRDRGGRGRGFTCNQS